MAFLLRWWAVCKGIRSGGPIFVPGSVYGAGWLVGCLV